MNTLCYLYYFKFNNYYNRQLKIKTTLNDYMQQTGGTYDWYVGSTLSKVNFNPNDQINTTQVLNDENIINSDYLLCVGDNNEILSRWFIVEVVRNCKGQWNATLKRDVLADNWSQVKNSPMMIDRAIVPNTSPFIFNPENVSCNQIKTNETLLKDETKCGWICGYIPRNYGKDLTEEQRTIEFDNAVIPDYSTYDFNDFRNVYLNNLQFNTYYKNNGWLNEIRIRCRSLQGLQHMWLIIYQDEQEGETVTNYRFEQRTDSTEVQMTGLLIDVNSTDRTFSYYASLLRTLNPINWNTFNNYKNLYIDDLNTYSNTNYDTINQKNGSYLHLINTDVDYKLSTTIRTSQSTTYNIYNDKATQYLMTYVITQLTNVQGITLNSGDNTIVTTFKYVYNDIKLTYTQIATGDNKIVMPTPTSRYTLKDAPYDMFCIPYGDCRIVIGSNTIDYSGDTAMYIAQGIAKGLSGTIIDLQLLPFTTMTGLNITTITRDNKQIPQFTINAGYTQRYTYTRSIIEGSSGNINGVILWATASKRTFDIDFNKSVTNYKMETITKKYRLCSPNYSGVYEFDVAKNKGISKINVDFNALPYNPYIHLNLVYNQGGLYGDNDFNDARGLICGGQFSISYLNDAWKQYELNNKNYQNSFNRQIDNMEVNHKINMFESGLNAITQSLGAGAGVGMLTGNIGTSALASGVSMLGGIADQFIQQDKYNEAKSYATDTFNMQLDNVKALPNTLSKVTAYTENNKVFPFIEEYDCTNEEKLAIANTLAYNSFTLGVIGTINDYLGNSWSYTQGDTTISDKGFIRGKLIKFNGNDDSHLANEIANRLNEGVYTK